MHMYIIIERDRQRKMEIGRLGWIKEVNKLTIESRAACESRNSQGCD